MIAFIGGLGTTEVLVILGVALLVFGGRRLPELGRSLGKGITEFKKGVREVQDDIAKAGQDSDDQKREG